MSYKPYTHFDDPNARSLKYLDVLPKVAEDDVAGLKRAQQSYGNSWKQRGGVGAFMMLARKWDRLENRCAKVPDIVELQVHGDRYDIFQHIQADQRSEGILDDIRDLRRYLMLIEAEVRARGINPGHRDNNGEDNQGLRGTATTVSTSDDLEPTHAG